MGRRGPEGDVTGSGPGGRNRAAAAAVAQRRAAEAQRAGAWTVSSTPGDQPTAGDDSAEDAGSRSPRLSPPRGAPSLPPESGHLVFPSAPAAVGKRVAATGADAGVRVVPPPPARPAALRRGPDARSSAARCRARCGRSLVLTAHAWRAKFARLGTDTGP